MEKNRSTIVFLLLDILLVVLAFLLQQRLKRGRGGYWQIFSGGVLYLRLRGYGLEWAY